MTDPKTTRSKQDFLTLEDQNRLLAAWQSQAVTAREAALAVNCSERCAQNYWAKFKSGWRPGVKVIRMRTKTDNAYVGTVEKKPMRAPNALPSVLNKITRGRA